MAVDVLANPQLLLPASGDDICCPTTDSKGMAVLSDLVIWTLRAADRVAIKVADITLLRAAAAISPTSLLEWLTLWVAVRTVVVCEHPNRRANTARTAPPTNHDRCRSAHGERGGA
jgi:hypothetical protein